MSSAGVLSPGRRGGKGIGSPLMPSAHIPEVGLEMSKLVPNNLFSLQPGYTTTLSGQTN